MNRIKEVLFKPDFSRLEKVLLRQGEPDIVPFFDLYPSWSFIEKIMGKCSAQEDVVDFYFKNGYDYSYAEISLAYESKQLVGAERSFVDNNHGIIESRADFDNYDFPVLEPEILANVFRQVAYLPDGMKLAVDFSSGGIYECVLQWMGYLPFSYALCDDEQLIWDIFEKSARDHLDAARLCIETIGKSKVGCIVMGDDLGYYSGTMVAPVVLKKYVLPFYKELVSLVHSYDLPFVLHSCGRLDAVMDDLIDFVGIDAKHSYEDKIQPVEQAKELYGSRIAILGGVDIDMLCRADTEHVRERVDRIIQRCAPGGGYALGTGNSLAEYIPVESYLAMLNQGRLAGVYPITPSKTGR